VRETGRRLATFPRQDGEELRVSLDCYKGHPFVNVHKWARGPGGRMVPLRGQGTTVRISEIDGAIAALREAKELVERGEPLPEWERAGPDGPIQVTPAIVRGEPAAIAVFDTPPWDTSGDGGRTVIAQGRRTAGTSAPAPPGGGGSTPFDEFGAGL
jgi:hypothetical protein